jgi:OmpA-OmpF porin, OOP family
MSDFVKFLIGLAGVVLLSLFAFYGNRDVIRDDLTARTQAALQEAGHSWASVTFGSPTDTRYRIAKITGVPDKDGAADAAVAVARSLHGVHDAVFDGDKTALATPFMWRADRENNQLVLSGSVPSEDAKAAIYKHAVEVFEPTIVVDKMTIADGAPAGDWSGIATLGLDELRKLEPGGYAMLSAKELTVWGTTPIVDVKQAIEKTMGTLPDGYLGRPTVTLATASPPAAPVNEPVTDPCEAKVANTVAGRNIGFASAKADLTAEGQSVLDDVATVLASCPKTSVTVAGHTDSRGDDAMNMALSQARADAVVTYLGSKGIAAGRMTAKGFGETAPLDTAQVPSAWAKNRRIEFKVVSAQ